MFKGTEAFVSRCIQKVKIFLTEPTFLLSNPYGKGTGEGLKLGCIP